MRYISTAFIAVSIFSHIISAVNLSSFLRVEQAGHLNALEQTTHRNLGEQNVTALLLAEEEELNRLNTSNVEEHDEEIIENAEDHGNGHDEQQGHGDGHGDRHGDGHGNGHGDGHGDGEHLGVHVIYEDIYAVLVFLLCATGLGKIFELIGMPSLVGEIFTGFLLGPPLLQFVPFPEAMVLVGEIGLIMLLLEAGVEIDVGQLKQTGTRALGIACTGSLLPLVVGFGIATAAGESWKSALAIGAAFSPTSLGVASKALSSGGMLNTPVGGLIVAACVVDDTIALVILSMFQVLVAENPAVWEYFIPIISAFGFLIVLGTLAVTFWPWFIEKKILPHFPANYKDTIMFSIMALVLMAYLPLLNYTRASYLSGAFLAGMSFSQIHSAHESFMNHTHQLMMWLLRVFFAASIGFQIPITRFGSASVIGWGFALYVAVLMKLPLGFFVPKFQSTPEGASFNPYIRDLIITGLAMSCRGEFSFIIASFGLSEGLYGPDVYSAVVWAVLISCATSPFLLLTSIKFFNKKQAKYLEESNPLKHNNTHIGDGKVNLHMHIHITSKVTWGMQEKFHHVLKELGLYVLDHRTDHKRGLDATVMTDIYVRDDKTRISLPTIEKQKRRNTAIRNASVRSFMNVDKLRSRVSSNSLDSLIKSTSQQELANVQGLSTDEKHLLYNLLTEKDSIMDRISDVREKLLSSIHQDDAVVVVTEWDPWDWSDAFDNMVHHHGGKITVDYFMELFDKIDADGGGTVDQDELYKALQDAGVQVSKDGLGTMIAMVDENNDGVISREEWKEAVNFYFEKKRANMVRESGMRVSRINNIYTSTHNMYHPDAEAGDLDTTKEGSETDSGYDVGLSL